MKKIRRLLDEYEIRFNVTDEILEEGYPFDSEIKKMEGFSEIRTYEIWNNNGKVYGYQFRTEKPVWATANVKELPEKWVVEAKNDNRYYDDFLRWYGNKHHDLTCVASTVTLFTNKGYSFGSDISKFIDHQYLTLEQWAEFYLAKVDFSILNDEDWFYAEDDTWLWVGNFLQNIYFCLLSGSIYRNNCPFIKENIKTFRKATEEDLKPLFEKHPELAPPKVGDYGLHYDTLKEEAEHLKRGYIIIDKLTKIRNNSFVVGGKLTWKYFYKIDMNAPLQPQIDEFLKLHDK